MEKYHSVSSFDQIKKRYEKYIVNADSLAMIERAYYFVEKMHANQKRKNNDPYIYHLLSVADILIDWKVGPKTICSALLHDVIEDQPVTYENLTEMFSPEIANVVKWVTKLTEFRSKNVDLLNYENLRRLLLGMANDIRVVIIKLADRLHNMRTLQYLTRDRQKAISNETLYVFAPIAQRLGMHSMAQELFDLSFMYLKSKEYKEIKEKYSANAQERQVRLNAFVASLRKKLSSKVNILDTKFRNKGMYSIYCKLNSMALSNNKADIFDLQAVRLIVVDISTCYLTLGYIHSFFRPILSRFKDYIAVPKNNLYQSLHTSVFYYDHIFEIQIRTPEMDNVAENGVAAHYAYKEGGSSAAVVTKEIDDRIKLFNDLIDLKRLDDESTSAKKFIDILKNDLFNHSIYAVTPKGKTITLPYGASVLDFAFKIHSDVGAHAQGALVNGEFHGIDTVLKSGDIVRIKTSSTINPKASWLTKVKTHLAKQKIKHFLRHESKEPEELIIERGKKLYQEFCEVNPNFKKWVLSNEKAFLSLLSKNSISTFNQLFIQLTDAKFNFIRILSSLKSYNLFSNVNKYFDAVKSSNKQGKLFTDLIIVSGMSNIKSKLAKCCNPKYGEKIIGYITKIGVVKVHTQNCNVLKNYSFMHSNIDDQFIDVSWNKAFSSKVNQNISYNIRIYGYRREELFNEIVSLFDKLNVNVSNIKADLDNAKERFTINCTVFISDNKILKQTLNNFRSLPGVTSVKHSPA